MRKKLLILPLVVCLLISVSAIGAAEQVDITILHTNDTHARVEEGKYAGMGFAKIATLVDKAQQDSDEVLVVDAGDAFHGQIIANLVEGKSIAQIYDAVGYDVMVPGNHDFNYGYQRLMELDEMTNFPLVAANLTKEDNEEAYPFVPGEIKQFDGVKVAFIGLTTPETAYKTHPKNVKGLKFNDPVAAAKKWVKRVKEEENPDLIIGLSHLGLSKGSKYTSADVAREVEDIDLIIDGHSHNVLEEGKVINNTPIVMAGEYTKHLGVINLVVEDGKLVSSGQHLISKQEAADVKKDKEIVNLIKEIKSEQDKITSQVIGKTAVELNGAREDIRTGETNLGNLVADAMLQAVNADVALTNGGGIRDSIAAGKITKGEIIKVLPFGNYIVVKKMKGSTLKEAVEHGLSQYPAKEGLFPQIGGMSFVFNPDQEPGNRLMELQVQGERIKPDKYYRVATNDFMSAGGDGYGMLKEPETVQEAGGLAEVVIEYINQHGEVAPEREGRIIPVVKSGSQYHYNIQGGDTLSELAIWLGVDMSELVETNKIDDPDLIYKGNELEIPAN